MSFLADATTHATRAHQLNGEAWELLSNIEGTRIKLTYTSIDGSKNSLVFPTVEEAAVHSGVIEAFWRCIVEVENESVAVKAQAHGELWVLIGAKILDHGGDFLPRDVQKAHNEIEEFIGGMETTNFN